MGDEARRQRDGSNAQYAARVEAAEEEQRMRAAQLDSVKQHQLSPGEQARRYKEQAKAEQHAFETVMGHRQQMADAYQHIHHQSAAASANYRANMDRLNGALPPPAPPAPQDFYTPPEPMHSCLPPGSTPLGTPSQT